MLFEAWHFFRGDGNKRRGLNIETSYGAYERFHYTCLREVVLLEILFKLLVGLFLTKIVSLTVEGQ